MDIVISGENRKQMELIEQLAKELGLNIRKLKAKKESRSEQKARSERLYKLMTEMAESGGIQSIKDPVAWQREIRKDKPLYGRE